MNTEIKNKDMEYKKFYVFQCEIVDIEDWPRGIGIEKEIIKRRRLEFLDELLNKGDERVVIMGEDEFEEAYNNDILQGDYLLIDNRRN